MTKICLIDYGAGNIYSAKRAFERCGSQVTVSCAKEDFEKADGLVMPGDGNFGSASLAIRPMRDLLVSAISSGKPFLGICVGMQLLFESSAESPGAKGLGLFDVKLSKFEDGLSCPQIGWNRLGNMRGRLFDGIYDGEWAYFIHSYKSDFSEFASAECDYGGRFVAALERGNIFATQFHPEKSGKAGERMIQNFIRFCKK